MATSAGSIQTEAGVAGDTAVAESEEFDSESVLTGEDVRIPQDFPKDVPLYNNMKLEMLAKDGAEGGYTLSAVSPDPYGKIVESFKKQADAHQWTEEMSADQDGLMYLMTYSKDSRILRIVVMKDDDQSSIMLTMDKASEE